MIQPNKSTLLQVQEYFSIDKHPPPIYPIQIKVFPAFTFGREDLDEGNKENCKLPSPMVFSIQNALTGVSTNVGVLAFEEECCILPNWLFEELLFEIGGEGVVQLLPGVPKGKSCILRPHKAQFLDLEDPKTLLENSLAKFTCITQNTTIVIKIHEKPFHFDVVETQPDGHFKCIHLIDTDLNVETVLPLDYKEPTKFKEMEVKQFKEEPIINQTFPGQGVKVTGQMFDPSEETENSMDSQPAYDPRKHRITSGVVKKSQYKGEGLKVDNKKGADDVEKEQSFIPSGCQFWHKFIIAANGDYFAFCSTMAIYFIRFSDFQVEKIIACHEHTITSITWSTQNSNHLASSGTDGWVYVWDIEKEKAIAKIFVQSLPLQIEFNPFDDDSIAVLLDNGDLKLFDTTKNKLDKVMSLDNAKVMRWNTISAGRLVVGSANGNVGIVNLKKNKTQKLDLKQKSSVEDIQWDPNSANYFLVCWTDGALSLVDADEEREMQVFERQGAGITCTAWLKNIPGGFVTCNEKISAVKVWNVSNKAPLSTAKVGNTGLLNILALHNTKFGKDGFLCTFKNGSVGVYNFGRKNLEFVSQPNHSETIFDLAFNIKDKNILATASYDGSIKIWQANEMRCITNLHKPDLNVYQKENFKQHVIYGIAWGPKDANRIVSVNSNGEVMLWDTDKGKLLSEIQPGSNAAIYRVDWNTLDPTLIASGSSDSQCFIYQTDGKKLALTKKIKHPATVFGVAWNPFAKEILATGCQDGVLRIYDVSGSQEKLVNSLSGHSARIFNVVWSPLIPNVIATGSDDKTVRVWDIKQNTCIVLSGHSNNVRALVWNSELPWLLLSGAWDSTICMWDIRDKKCIHVANEHHADVYGIASHPERPFVYVSCSRDTSVRFWSVERLVAPLLLRVIGSNDWDDVLGNPPQGLNTQKDPLKLVGTGSRTIYKDVNSIQKYSVDYFQKILDFFSYLDYQKEFWDIVKSRIKGKTEDASNRVISLQNLPSTYLSRAQELESSGSQSGFSYDAMNKKADKIMDAAKLYLKLGEFELYCEALVKLGKWEKALSFAPAVSYEYWKNLAKRYSEELNSQDNEDAVSYFLLSGQTEEAIKFCMGRGDYEDSKLIAALKMNNKFAQLEASDRYKQVSGLDVSTKFDPRNYNREEVREVIENLAATGLETGHPLLAACHHLSIDDAQSAVIKLLRANELIYAFAICKLYDLPLISQVAFLLGKRGERYGERNLGQILLHNFGDKNRLALYCASVPVDIKLLKELYKQNDIQSPEEFEKDAAKCASNKDIVGAVRNYILAKNTEKAAAIAVEEAQDAFKSANYAKLGAIMEAFEFLFYGEISAIPQMKLKFEVIGFCLYFGLKKAIWRGCYPIVIQFYQALKKFIKDRGSSISFPVDRFAIKLEVLSFYALSKPEETQKKLAKMFKKVTNENLKAAMNNLLKNMTQSAVKEGDSKKIDRQLNKHRVYIPGNNLPTHVNTEFLLKSFLSNIPVKAEGYAMEDNQSIFTLEEALMWANCCLVSPLQTGYTINPF